MPSCSSRAAATRPPSRRSRSGRDATLAADGVAVVPIGGAQSIGRFLRHYGPEGLGVRLAGLCDAGEERDYRRGLERAGLGAELTGTAWRRSASSSATPISRRS
jgi:hypothetical protein